MSQDLNLQHNFLEEIKQEDMDITVYLKNGVQIQGKLAGYDDYVISVSTEEEIQMIMKKAITTVEPEEEIRGYFPEEF
ncbi:RNA chaperone Hfq [Halarsenatibacter silvermanii]|uniref:RNA-binding protein Hfq n=1 Tax=Halarsenatibacter silvermanii TaxID=321763 RepID=A0A1G9KQ24_9FIRM|nr:RNA chaperone Hfq [Halarsenatibacter silvermanii]SDL51587.1 RNA-binding protein Hfq [Halarsenatibacter silvermanii]